VSELDFKPHIAVSDVSAATIMARKGVSIEQLTQPIGLKPPSGPAHAEAKGLRLIGTGPGSWLALREDREQGWLARIEHALKGLASVSNQSGSYCLFKIGGPGARRLLQRGACIDLHPDAFHADSVATTVIAHIGVTFWQGDSNEAFELLTFRSYAHSFQTWIESVSRTR
jgi:heterotetrameric sarcosine oxidase gamma subunit